MSPSTSDKRQVFMGSSARKKLARKLRFALYRYPTSPLRPLPDFIIVGAQKCGTSSLYFTLERQPDVLRALQKEVHFFDNPKYHKGLNWYRAYFPLAPYRSFVARGIEGGCLTGEASPYYLFHPHVPARIARVLPEVKLIALLRNPVDRAFSHYQHNIRQKRETLSFEDALQAEEGRLKGVTERMLRDDTWYSKAHQHLSYLAKGVYADQLETWFRHFDREQMLILESGEFFRDTATVFSRVRAFLGLPDRPPGSFKKYNSGGRYEKMTPAVRERLQEYFEPHNRRLYELLGTDFGW